MRGESKGRGRMKGRTKWREEEVEEGQDVHNNGDGGVEFSGELLKDDDDLSSNDGNEDDAVKTEGPNMDFDPGSMEMGEILSALFEMEPSGQSAYLPLGIINSTKQTSPHLTWSRDWFDLGWLKTPMEVTLGENGETCGRTQMKPAGSAIALSLCTIVW